MLLILCPLGSRETLNKWSQFQVNRTYDSWVSIISFINEYSKLKIWKRFGAKKLKIFLILTKVAHCSLLVGAAQKQADHENLRFWLGPTSLKLYFSQLFKLQYIFPQAMPTKAHPYKNLTVFPLISAGPQISVAL